jgi:hypothetical protein
MPPPLLPGGEGGGATFKIKENGRLATFYRRNFQNGLLVFGLVCLDAKLGHRIPNVPYAANFFLFSVAFTPSPPATTAVFGS